MKKIHIITLLALVMGFTACSTKKEDPSPSTNNSTPKKSKLALLCQTWILDETYEDGVKKTSGGTDQYQYTKQGQFKFNYNGTWTDIGSYDFTSKDSTAISVLFGSTTTVMALKTLDDKNLKTEFMSGGKKLNYNYKR